VYEWDTVNRQFTKVQLRVQYIQILVSMDNTVEIRVLQGPRTTNAVHQHAGPRPGLTRADLNNRGAKELETTHAPSVDALQVYVVAL
jgi:hypothetical protein